MRNSSRRLESSTPVLGRVPGLRRLFGSSREVETKTELVILLRPIVVDEDEDWAEIMRPAAERIETLGDLQARRNQESR
jgi:MSHA biogenesis protein MshL